MSERVIIQKEDWQAILDAVRYGTEKGELLRSDEVASEVGAIFAESDSVLNGSVECYKNSRLTKVRNYAFDSCNSLTSVVLPNVTTLGQYAFRNCSNLKAADFSSISRMGSYAFFRAITLDTLIIRTGTLCELESTSSLSGTQISSGEAGYVYVPAALVEEYKLATNWTTFAERIRAIEDYPEITGEAI